MPDKEKATKLLGFRDDKGALVCPADVVDLAEVYTCHIGAEDGSYTPTEDDLKTIGSLFKAVGLTGAVTKEKGKGGTVFYNKKGVVICRIIKGVTPKTRPAKPPLETVKPTIAPEKTASGDTTAEVEDAEAQAKAADSKAKAADKATVKTTPAKKPAKKTKKKKVSRRVK